MKFNKTAIALLITLTLVGCSNLKVPGTPSSPKTGESTQSPRSPDIGMSSPRTADTPRVSDSRLTEPKSQDDKKKLTTSFARQGVKLEWECVHKEGIAWKTCEKYEIIAVEATAYSASFGITEPQRERAFKVAEAKAKAKLAHFVREEVKSTSTITTLARNIEKAKSSAKTNAQSDFSVNLDDADVKDKNYDTSESTTETAQTVAETITVGSELIMRGLRIIDEKTIDRRTVAVTVRWDIMGDDGAASLQNKFTTK